jgi:1-acyl-sn-glycerol-3-phosphate acyltransferase
MITNKVDFKMTAITANSEKESLYNSVTGFIRGVTIGLLILTNTFFWFPFLLILTLLKLVIPFTKSRKLVTMLLIELASAWVSFNSFLISANSTVKWSITGVDTLKKKEWYFVNCNHQSWADIPIAQKVMNDKVPMLKFFLKKELIWVPIMGVSWWALDFPFMKRFSREYLKKHPEMRGKDLETTQKACEKFKYTPISVFNFLEGTRITKEKHQKQKSPYKHLLKPKYGGASFVMQSLGEQMKTMLDMTIFYPDGIPTIWQLMCGKTKKIIVNVRSIHIPVQFRSGKESYDKEEFKVWMTQQWRQKDTLMSQLKSAHESDLIQYDT